jgi:hypothetical protein
VEKEQEISKITWRRSKRYPRTLGEEVENTQKYKTWRRNSRYIQDHLEREQEICKTTWSGEGARDIQDQLGKEQEIYKITWSRSIFSVLASALSLPCCFLLGSLPPPLCL